MHSRTHPLIAMLLVDCKAPGDAAEREFWQQIESARAPLVEPIDSSHSWVTFIYRLDAGQHHSCVRGIALSPAHSLLPRIGNSNVAAATFRIRNDRRFGYDFVADVPLVDPVTASPAERRALGAHMATHAPQPDRYAARSCVAQFGSASHSEFEMPAAEPQPHFSTDASPRLQEVLPADVGLKTDRPISVYQPSATDSVHPLPTVYVISADGYLNRMWANGTLDRLIEGQHIPPILGVFIDPARDRTIRNDFGFDPAFQDDLAMISAWMQRTHRAAQDPRHNAIGGASVGGLTALNSAARRPDLFGNVISQSGSFWMRSDSWQATDVNNPDLRVFLEVGRDEHPERMIEPNRKLRDHLVAQKLEISYSEFSGGHDYVCWRGTFADAMIFAFGGLAAQV